MMDFFNPDDRSFKEIAPGVRIRTFWGEKMLLAVVNLEANALLASHSHPHEQCSYVLEGELEFHIAKEVRLLRPGELVVIPGGTEHFVKVGALPAKVLDIFSPPREEFKY